VAGNLTNLWATSIPRIEGVGRPTTGVWNGIANYGIPTVNYNITRTTINFESLLYPVANFKSGKAVDESGWTQYVVVEPSVAGQMITFPKAIMKFVSSEPIPAGAKNTAPELHGLSLGKTFPTLEQKVTWKNVPTWCVPSSSVNRLVYGANGPLSGTLGIVESYLGTINRAVWNGYAIGQVLYVGATLRPIKSWYVDHQDFRFWDVTYTFLIHPDTTGRGWASLPFVTNQAPAKWAYVEVSADGTTNIPGSAHNGADGFSVYGWKPLPDLFRPVV
jgi:hypothetical protein